MCVCACVRDVHTHTHAHTHTHTHTNTHSLFLSTRSFHDEAADERDRRVVYGTDDRVDEAGASAFWRGIGKSTVMLVSAQHRMRV